MCSAVGVTCFRRAMYPAPRIAAASCSLTRPGANFLRDGVASFGHHVARPIRSLFTQPRPLANTGADAFGLIIHPAGATHVSLRGSTADGGQRRRG